MPAMKDIPAHYVTEFASNWEHLCQQKMSKCREYVLVDSVNGKEKKYNQMGESELQAVTIRAGDTRITDVDLPARWLRPFPLDDAKLIDEWDETFLGTVVLPQSDVVQSQAYAYNRAVDRTIINAALGTSYTGEMGVDPTPLPAAQVIPVGFVESGSAANSGLTIGKLRQAKFLLDDAEVDDDEARTIAVCAKQLQDLLRTTEVTSSDYNTVKALVDGKVDTYMGFKFTRISRKILPLDVANDIRTCVAFAKSGVKISDSGRKVHIDVRVDKSHALQIRVVAALGGTRMEEVKVVSILCDQSP
jgi:hypothetical protein